MRIPFSQKIKSHGGAWHSSPYHCVWLDAHPQRTAEWLGGSSRAPGGMLIRLRLDARRLSFYHEKKDEARNIRLGPQHDWSSHACDAFGLMAIVYEEPPVKSAPIRRPSPPRIGSHWSA